MYECVTLANKTNFINLTLAQPVWSEELSDLEVQSSHTTEKNEQIALNVIPHTSFPHAELEFGDEHNVSNSQTERPQVADLLIMEPTYP